MKRNLKDYGLLVLKGMGMGAADVVPGVSGGTIAFIVGIYEELIDSIKSINGASLKLLFTGKIAAFWKAINANFLLSIIAGDRDQYLLIGKNHYLAVDRPPYSGLVLLLRIGTCFHLVRFQRYQEMGLENDPELYHRDRYCILHNGCDTSRDTFQPVLYLPLRSDSHLCHDPAGYIG